MFGSIVFASAWLASIGIFALMLLVVADVGMRFLFNAPIAGVNEIMEIAIVAMLYLHMTQALRNGRITRSDTFFNKVMARNRGAGLLLSAATNAAGALLMAVFLWAAVPRLVRAYSGDFFIGNAGAFMFPEWPLRLVIVFGCALMALQFTLLALYDLRASSRWHIP